MTNLVKHVESSLRKFQNTVEGIIDDNNGEAWIDREDARRCHRIMEAVNQGMKSLQENRDGEVEDSIIQSRIQFPNQKFFHRCYGPRTTQSRGTCSLRR